MQDKLDFIQPKKVVGEMISMSVIEDIKEKIAKCKSAWEAEEWDYYTAGRSEAYRDALIIIDEHISGKEQT